jgi:hypothetical protein
MRYGEMLQSVLMRQDEQIRKLDPASVPVAQSMEALSLIRELNTLGDREDVYSSWLQPSSKNPKFDTMRARRTDLDVQPGNPFFVYYASLVADINVPHNTYYPINLEWSFLTTSKDSPCVIRTDGTKIYSNFKDAFINVSGIMAWSSSSNTGERTVEFNYYDSTDALVDSRPIQIRQAESASFTFNTLSASYPCVSPESDDPGQYFQIEVFQTSGGNLPLYIVNFKISLAFQGETI